LNLPAMPDRFPLIDLRSDTVTRPTAAMRAAMAEAAVGDDVFGDDPTVIELQQRAARIFGRDAALFFPSGTQSNLAAWIAHCKRGDAAIVGGEAHTYVYEAGGAAVLGSIVPKVLPNQPDGTLELRAIEASIAPDDAHFAPVRMLALENTIHGRVLPGDYLPSAAALAKRLGLSTHLDGARIFNASVALGVPVDELTSGFDTVSVCLSKGLGAPVGTVLVGTRELIARAHRARKILGGGMRQAGILAAAGLYALAHHVERLAEDHAHAKRLAEGLSGVHGVAVDAAQTNMVFVRVPADRCAALQAHLRERGVVALVGPRTRLVTHLDVDADGVDRAIAAFGAFFG
jgi:threonine aldolase